MLRTVLVPVGFDDDSDLILSFAKGLPALGVRRVVLCNVVEASGMEGPIIARTVDEVRDKLHSLSAPLEAAGLGVELRVPAGDPFDEIGALANEMQVDALCYGSHAKSVVDQLFVGSVSERLLRDATVPHLIARFDLLRLHDDPAKLLSHFGEKLVLPTDFSLSASRAFTKAVEMPRGTLKQIFLMHSIDPTLAGDKLRRAEEGAEFHLKNLQAMCAQAGISASVSIRRGTPVQSVLEELDDRRATGVIVGTRGRNAVQEMLMGSVSMTLVRQASCPVMIVP